MTCFLFVSAPFISTIDHFDDFEKLPKLLHIHGRYFDFALFVIAAMIVVGVVWVSGWFVLSDGLIDLDWNEDFRVCEWDLC